MLDISRIRWDLRDLRDPLQPSFSLLRWLESPRCPPVVPDRIPVESVEDFLQRHSRPILPPKPRAFELPYAPKFDPMKFLRKDEVSDEDSE